MKAEKANDARFTRWCALHANGYSEYQTSNMKQLFTSLRESLQGRLVQRLEPDEVKVISPVLRGLRVGNNPRLPDRAENANILLLTIRY